MGSEFPPACKPYGLEAGPEARFRGLGALKTESGIQKITTGFRIKCGMTEMS